MEKKSRRIEFGKKQQVMLAVILAVVAMVGAYFSAYYEGEAYRLFFEDETYSVMVKKAKIAEYGTIASGAFRFALYGLFLLLACGMEKLLRVHNFITAIIVLFVSGVVYVFGTYYMKNPLIYTPMMIFEGTMPIIIADCLIIYVFGRVLVKIKNR